MSIKASAATLEVATKQNVGAAASKSQTHVGLNSGHIMPLLGWGTSQATGDECIKATKAAIEAGFRVSLFHSMLHLPFNCNVLTICMLLVLSLYKCPIFCVMQHIDTAEMYKNEQDIGKALQQLLKSGAVKREDLFVTSKLWTEHHPGDQVRPGLMDSLSRLQLEYLDLYLIHW